MSATVEHVIRAELYTDWDRQMLAARESCHVFFRAQIKHA